MSQHGAQPFAIHDPAGKLAEFALHTRELPPQSCRAWSRRTFVTKKRFVMSNDVVELAKRAFALDGQTEVGVRRAGIAFEHGDRG
ncbi:hypothetical protein, partial [Klebsiella pneumoniae]|uniref:hypothetical protein n=1 Tax=Klebsiella pneumoniae TaxID=573 RepID=UPI0013D82625